MGLMKKGFGRSTEDKRETLLLQCLPFSVYFETWGLPRRKKRQG